MRSIKPLYSLILITTLAAGVRADDDSAAAKPTAEACGCCNAKTGDGGHASYELRGEIQTVMAKQNALVVRHEAIPGFMKAMTMMFRVDPQLLPRVKPGDIITAQMKRSPSGAWMLENVQLTDS